MTDAHDRAEFPAINDRGGGNVTIFFKNTIWKRRPNTSFADSVPEWHFKTSSGRFAKVRPELSIGLDEICRHLNAIRFRHLPRLAKGLEAIARNTLIRTLPDIPLTSELEGQTIHWLVDAIIPERSLILLSAPPGSYKTWLGLSMMDAISRGKDFLGRATRATAAVRSRATGERDPQTPWSLPVIPIK